MSSLDKPKDDGVIPFIQFKPSTQVFILTIPKGKVNFVGDYAQMYFDDYDVKEIAECHRYTEIEREWNKQQAIADKVSEETNDHL